MVPVTVQDKTFRYPHPQNAVKAELGVGYCQSFTIKQGSTRPVKTKSAKTVSSMI